MVVLVSAEAFIGTTNLSAFSAKLVSTYSLLAALLLVIGVPTFLISLSLKLKSYAVKVIEVVLGLVSLTEVDAKS